jgi:cell division protein FtsB
MSVEAAAVPGVGASNRSVVRVQPSRRLRFTARAAGLGFVSLLVLMLAIAPAKSYLRQRGRLADLRQQTQELQQENAKLQERVTQLKDPAHLEILARQCLGMVKPGQIAFVTVPEHGAPTPPAC